MQWQTTWTQALIDISAMQRTFTDVTLRTRLAPTIGGDTIRLELSNRFGTEPVVLGHVAVLVDGHATDVTFDGRVNATIPAGGNLRSDTVAAPVRHGSELTVDLYLPEPTGYATANVMGSPFQVSGAGDLAGRTDLDAAVVETVHTPDGQDIVLSAPFLTAVEVSGGVASAVIVCFGDSITVMGWPGLTAALLPDEPAVAVLNRGIAGNRLRFDPAPQLAMFGRSGLARFDDDVLATEGATHVVLALGTNDLGHPGTMAPPDQLPTTADLIDASREVIDRAQAAGLRTILTTIPPFLPAPGYDEARDAIRNEVNAWIRAEAPAFVDFDEALRSADDPSRLVEEYDSGDHLHPSEAGQARMAQTMAEGIGRLLAARQA